MKVDATAGVARVIFDNVSYLGIEEENYQIGDVITVASGIRAILIYNGAESGPLTFDISFSGAAALITGAASLVALMSFSRGFSPNILAFLPRDPLIPWRLPTEGGEGDGECREEAEAGKFGGGGCGVRF